MRALCAVIRPDHFKFASNGPASSDNQHQAALAGGRVHLYRLWTKLERKHPLGTHHWWRKCQREFDSIEPSYSDCNTKSLTDKQWEERDSYPKLVWRVDCDHQDQMLCSSPESNRGQGFHCSNTVWQQISQSQCTIKWTYPKLQVTSRKTLSEIGENHPLQDLAKR